MAKLAFLVPVLVALMALSTAEGYSTLQSQCQRELQESSLDACRQVVDHQLAVQLPFLIPRSSQLRTGVQMQCCQQLRDVSQECRTAAIRQIVRQYEHQALVPLRDDPYYPGEDEEEQEGESYHPGETYPQQEQGWEQQQGQGRQTFPQQQEPWWRKQQHGQGSYQPSETFPQQGEQGPYRPSQTYRPQQEQGSYRPSQTYHPQQHQQGSYRPSQSYPQQQEQGSYRPSQTYRPQQHQQGSYRPSQKISQQQQQEGGFYGQSTAHHHQQQQQQGTEEPYRLRITIYGPARQPSQHELDMQQQEGQDQSCGRQSQQAGFGRFSSPPRFGSQQQVARLRVVAKARQVVAQLPAMCRLASSAFSTSEQ